MGLGEKPLSEKKKRLNDIDTKQTIEVIGLQTKDVKEHIIVERKHDEGPQRLGDNVVGIINWQGKLVN